MTARTLIRVLVVTTLLAFTALTAFVAGLGTASFLEAVPSVVGVGATPTLSPTEVHTPTPTTSFPPPPTPSDPDEETFELFWEVWEIVQREFYGDLPTTQEVTYGAIQGMLETLGDEHTSFIEPRIAAIIDEDASGSFEGIGAYVRTRSDGYLEITGVFPGQPAELAGLQRGDIVLAVDGESIVGFGTYEAISLIRGPAGSSVTLLIERPGEDEPFERTIVRARIAIPLVESEMLEEGAIAYIRLTEFSATASSQMDEELRSLLEQQPAGLILDLRDNPGGWLDQAVRVSDLFLPEGTVLIERSGDDFEHTYTSDDGDVAESIPLVVLVNGGTASASEIVAGAIQDRDRGILVGEQSFGKGSVQRPYRLSDGSELRVTIARWYTPDDIALQGEGLLPDIVIALRESPEEDSGDLQLERAVEYLLTGE